MNADEMQIRELVRRWLEASRTGDVEAVLKLVADDVVFLVAGREPMRKAEFAALALRPRGDGGSTVEATSEIQEIRVSGDWACMWTKLKMVARPPGGGPPSVQAGTTLSVLRKEGGRWLLARDANLLTPVPH